MAVWRRRPISIVKIVDREVRILLQLAPANTLITTVSDANCALIRESV